MTVYTLPYTGFMRCRLVLDDGTVSATTNKRVTMNVTQIVEPVWSIELTTTPVKPYSPELAAWQAWKAKLRGGIHTFAATDYRRGAPLNYLTATSAGNISSGWNGTAGVTTLGASGVLTLNTLPVGYVATAGDLIGLEQSGRYDLYRVIVGGTANGSGVLVITVSPFLRTTVFTTSAVARLWQPVATFIIKNWQEPDDVSQGPITFTGTQRI